MSRAYPAELYALVHKGNSGDLGFYREQCEGSLRTLELGCGYGRILEGLVDDGVDVVGLDLDPDLLSLANRNSRARIAKGRPGFDLVRGDMRSFCFRQRFDRVLIPFTGIYCLGSRHDCLSCLRSCADHLAPAGRLIFDAYSADALQSDLDEWGEARVLGDGFERITSVAWRNETYEVFEKTTCGDSPQSLDVRYRYEAQGSDAIIEGRILHRYLLSRQIPPLLEEAGLRLLGLHGDFGGGPLLDDSDNMIVIAESA